MKNYGHLTDKNYLYIADAQLANFLYYFSFSLNNGPNDHLMTLWYGLVQPQTVHQRNVLSDTKSARLYKIAIRFC